MTRTMTVFQHQPRTLLTSAIRFFVEDGETFKIVPRDLLAHIPIVIAYVPAHGRARVFYHGIVCHTQADTGVKSTARARHRGVAAW